MPPPIPATSRLAVLRALYALHYAGGGLWVPYLAPFLEASGISGSAQGLLFALRNITFVVTLPLLGIAADRIGVAHVLRFSAFAAAAAWILMLTVQTPLAFVGVFLLMAVGVSAVSSLVDAAVIGTLEGPGGEAAGGTRAYARSRIWGSVGFAASALVFGFAVAKEPGSARTAMLVVATLHGIGALFSLAAPATARSPRPPNLADAAAILREPGVRAMLIAGALHWISLAPYHTFFGAHVEHHGGGPMTIGLSIAVSVAVELVVMATAPRWLAVFSPRTVLCVAGAAGIARWSLTALGSPPVIIAAQALHGLSYGAYFLAMVDVVTSRTAPEHRATAQALIASIALGIGTFFGNLVAGPIYDIDHGRSLFLAAAGFSVVSAAAALRVPSAR